MTHWNHRVVRRIVNGEEWLAIHEVFYDKKGRPHSVTEDGIEPGGNNMEELRSDLERMAKALDHPILDYDKFTDKGYVE